MKPLYQILEIAKEFLSGFGGDNDFICNALNCAYDAEKITKVEHKKAIAFIRNKINNQYTLIDFLKTKGVITDDYMHAGSSAYKPYRDAWLNKQIANLKKNIRVQKDTPDAAILRKAKEVIAKPENWTQGAFARLRNGQVTDSTSPNAYCFCALGAIRKVNQDCVWPAANFLVAAIGHIPTFNDKFKTRHEDVLQAFDKAIKLANQKKD